MARIVTLVGLRPEILKMVPVVRAPDGLRGRAHLLAPAGRTDVPRHRTDPDGDRMTGPRRADLMDSELG